eukprot:TRINITY_DN1275_c0_g1::TRINITY_DN1275_c0_g1_i1::g.26879::m.26879 TRINITY_DN1275_c0_g1::TRINITY_DN1275_c0_g1_i1::g.26879  ORF type:complete len:443 (+),score=165.10,sp/Q9FLQ4/ODO2A_ARATH/54.26/3e-129,2-oxoacid_dh/PF00198.18/8.4e-80,Biotin_lipoyl/PF00364.17/2.2e-17,Biotin_lipoyl_2/PF13533.1/0.011,Biotin_lipoyl_2/PF13533.1/2.1e+02,HlyD_2/PF12700.2/0.39,HlyD_2/PF12700.2/1.3e+03 TRINITY_DN1275_c0_g1_i1:43-1329(+)
MSTVRVSRSLLPATARLLSTQATRAVALAAPRQIAQRSVVCAAIRAPQQVSFNTPRYFSTGADKDVVVPHIADSISTGTIASWLKEEGDQVEVDDVLCQLETDKVTVDVRAQEAGVLTKKLASPGETVNVGAKIGVIAVGAKGKAAAPKEAEKPKEAPKAAAPKAAPTKPAEKKVEAPKPADKKPQAMAPPVFATERGERRVPMNNMRKRIAQRLKDSQNTAATLTTFNEIDMTNLFSLRNTYKDLVQKKHGIKLGFMSAFVRASVAALETQPTVNAVIDGNDVVYRDFVDVSVAVATPTGLVVPVIRDCHRMSMIDVEKKLADLSDRARTGQISIDEMIGGTFTISNGGVFGSLFGTPIINQPQSAILGMHATNMRPVAIDGKVEIRPMMYVALTYDHRIIDGREAVTFLKQIKQNIEDPRRILLDV